jgi:hypothetical protein
LAILIKGDRCQKILSIPLSCAFEDGMKVPSPIYGGLHSSFHTICKKKIKSAQEIILDKLHKHSFFITILDMVFDLHYARLKSYVGLGVNAWFFVHLVILAFCMASNIFSSKFTPS